ncbi:hypothetical protein RJ641_030146 [Dillenia turbinata]|uniref:Uncharacterized protein n=1 Tax=Dillenia turbinata TaxID=194707 RepID=A0AAN8VV38_9MAGN
MDCSEMLDQTLYELGEAIGVLHNIPDSATPFVGKSNSEAHTSFSHDEQLPCNDQTDGDVELGYGIYKPPTDLDVENIGGAEVSSVDEFRTPKADARSASCETEPRMAVEVLAPLGML